MMHVVCHRCDAHISGPTAGERVDGTCDSCRALHVTAERKRIRSHYPADLSDLPIITDFRHTPEQAHNFVLFALRTFHDKQRSKPAASAA